LFSPLWRFPVSVFFLLRTNTFSFTSMTRLKHFVEAEISASAATVIGS